MLLTGVVRFFKQSFLSELPSFSATRSASPSCSPPRCGSASPITACARCSCSTWRNTCSHPGARRATSSACRREAGARGRCSARSTCSRCRVADLRPLHRLSSISRRSSAASLADRVLGQRKTRHHRRAADGDRPFHDGDRALFLSRCWLLILGNGAFKPNISTQVGSLYPPGDQPPRPRLLDLLCRHQCRRVPLAADLRHAGRRSRLALRLRRRRRRHDASAL